MPRYAKISKYKHFWYGCQSSLFCLRHGYTNPFPDSNKGSSHDFLAGHAIQKIVRDAKNQILAAKTKYDHGINVATEYKEVQKQPDLTGPSAVPIDPSSEVLENEFALYFKKQACIGEGSHGKVYKVQETSTKELYACKFSRLPPTFLQKDRKASIQRGIFTLKKLRHIHIVTIVTYRENREGFTILMEPLADYDLSNMFSGHTSSTKAEDRADLMYPWFGCLLNALSFAHAHAVKHRDIKPENILVKDKHIYLSDFSLAKDFTGQLMSVSLSEEVRGTLHYRAPETHDGTPGGRRADVFSLGCVYSEMLTFIHGKSTKDFLKRRQTENETGMFRKSLEAVRNWLGDINKGLAENSPSKQVVITTRRMLEEDWEFRYQSHIAMRSIEDKDELRCRHSMR